MMNRRLLCHFGVEGRTVDIQTKRETEKQRIESEEKKDELKRRKDEKKKKRDETSDIGDGVKADIKYVTRAA